MKKSLFSILVIAALLVMVCGATAEVPSYDFNGVTVPVIADTENGKVLGYRYNGISVFKGIPYAEAERFEMPQKPASWEEQGIRKALVFAPAVPQPLETNSAEFLSISDKMVVNEKGSLALNVCSPDTTASELKPVLFWIHGGGYASGASNELEMYNGENIAKYGDVVFVSVNHRLNVLGYLDLSAYGDDYKYTGNLGHTDLIMALEWVRDNIANFGGDPQNVTIVGQSGGGTKVTQLMGMPAAKGLFHKAVALSGGSAQSTKTSDDARAEAAAVVEYLGLNGKTNEEIIAALKALPYAELRAACDAVRFSPKPVVDGDYYPTGTFEISKDIPMIVSRNMGEMSINLEKTSISFFGEYMTQEVLEAELLPLLNADEDVVMARINEKFGEKAEAAVKAFKEAYPSHNLCDLLFTAKRNNSIASAKAEMGGTVYQSVTAYNMPIFGGCTAVHTGGDVPLWFRNINHTDMQFWYAGDEECATKVMDEMSGALINFCYTGNPSTEALPWAPFTVENGETMVFDRVSEVRNYHDKDLMELYPEGGSFGF